MPKAVRFKSNGKYLRNTLFSCPGLDYVGSGTAMRPDFDPSDGKMRDAVALEEDLSIASWTQDFAIAFGIPADEIECEVIPWDGDPASLPKEDEPDAHVRLPEPPEPPKEQPPIERVLAALGKDAALSAATKTAIADALK